MTDLPVRYVICSHDNSVVSPFGQSHSVRNLFVCDGSLFVTSSASNPTLTIQALATRTADYILREKNNLI